MSPRDESGTATPATWPFAQRRFAAVLFDLDGTLIDSTPAVLRSWGKWAMERGLTRGPEQVPHGVPARQVLATLVEPHEIESAFARIEEIEVAEVEGITVLPGTLQALAALPRDRTAIVTSGTPPLVRSRLATTALPAPDLIITADDVAVGKPDPAPYLLAAQRLGVDPRQCLVVEDAHAGFASARAAGCAVLGLRTTTPHERLDADAVVDTLADVRFTVTAPDEGDASGLVIGVAPITEHWIGAEH